MKGRVGLIDMGEQLFAWTNVMAATRKKSGRVGLIVWFPAIRPWWHRRPWLSMAFVLEGCEREGATKRLSGPNAA